MNPLLLALAALPPLVVSSTPVQAAGKPLTVLVGNVTAIEGRSASVPITLSGGNGRIVTITYSGTFGSGTISAKTGTYTVNIPLPDNQLVDGTRSVPVRACVTSGTVHPCATGTVTELDNDVTPPAITWAPCAQENGTCYISGTANVRYGAGAAWVTKSVTGSVACSNAVFGDPIVGTVKECDTDGTVAQPPAAPPVTTTPPPPTTDPMQPPAPLGGYVVSPTLDGEPDFTLPYDASLGLQQTAVNTTPYAPGEGKFRFTCGSGGTNRDDMIMFPGQPNASHRHRYWGKGGVDAYTTGDTLLTLPGGSTCMNTTYLLNFSAYWMTALSGDDGRLYAPDLVSVYYDRFSKSSPQCTVGNPRAVAKNGCVGLPNGIRFVFGFDPTNPKASMDPAPGNPRSMTWYCDPDRGGHYTNLDDLLAAGCTVGNSAIADLLAGNCWDGKWLDVPDHRSHVVMGAYSPYDGQYHCPDDHPYLIPQTENKPSFTITTDWIGHRADGSIYSRVRCSSDEMLPGAKACGTMHADYREKWFPPIKRRWTDNCIDKALSCNSGDLGDGWMLRGAAQPIYGWKNPNEVEAAPAN